jgi:hypothetical protein
MPVMVVSVDHHQTLKCLMLCFWTGEGFGIILNRTKFLLVILVQTLTKNVQ